MIQKIKSIFQKKKIVDVRFWLIGFFLVRLYGITQAPLEPAHSWRQGLTAMIARNFHKNGLNLFHPMIDMAGEKTGIIGSEFPIFNALIYLMSAMFGYDHWYGRLINLIICSIALLYFYKLLKNLFKEKIAFHATYLLALSMWFSYARKIMPDTFSVALLIIGIYFAYQYLIKGNYCKLIISFLLITLGGLSKIPAISLLFAFAVIPFVSEINRNRKITFILTITLSLGLIFLWYFYWVPHLTQSYGYQLYFPKSLLQGFKEIKPLWIELLDKFAFSAFFSYTAFVLYICGSFLLFWKKEQGKFVRWSFISISLIFGYFILKTGAVFPTHSYYLVPFVPVMAIVAAFFTAQLKPRWSLLLILFFTIETIGNQQDDFFISDKQNYKLEAENFLDEHIPSDAKIIFNAGPSPQKFYFLNRKGWNLEPHEITQITLDSLYQQGAQYLVLDLYENIAPEWTKNPLATNGFYAIYALNPRYEAQ